MNPTINPQATGLQVFYNEEANVNVRTTMIDSKPWFVAKDVCDALGLVNSRKATSSLDNDEKGVSPVVTPSGVQEMTVVNESGLYGLIFLSRKPEAKTFRKWVTSEVLPCIRKTGVYEVTAPVFELPKKSTRSGLNAKTLELLWTIDSMLVQGDIKSVAAECGVCRQTIHAVLAGKNRNPKVLSALYQRALDNTRDVKSNPYANSEKAIKKLLQ